LGRVCAAQKAHRGGKTVIVVYDFAPHIGGGYLEKLAGKLSGVRLRGTVRSGR